MSMMHIRIWTQEDTGRRIVFVSLVLVIDSDCIKMLLY